MKIDQYDIDEGWALSGHLEIQIDFNRVESLLKKSGLLDIDHDPETYLTVTRIPQMTLEEYSEKYGLETFLDQYTDINKDTLTFKNLNR